MTESRSAFHHQLDEVHQDLIRAAGRVTELISRGTQALLDMDLDAVQGILDSDDEIDAVTLDVEERCFLILARQQPMASDMRALVTAIRLTSEIERSGDLVVNIGKAIRRLHPTPVPAALRGLLQRMSDEAVRLFRLAMDAYAEGDDRLAATLDEMDDRLDQVHKDYIQALLESCKADGDVQQAVQLALVGRYYERIGDHAVNIGERVRYMVTGWLPEHAGAARHRSRHSGPDPAAAPARPTPSDSADRDRP
ncbi:MAG: phosphate signaling complex protein PhoU [Acidimicrobiia bacterium]|jgi:phosphate transport system protein